MAWNNGHIIAFFLSFSMLVGKAQENSIAEITLWPDQQVYISSEEIWLQGLVTGKFDDVKRISIRLYDRTGTIRSETSVFLRSGGFSGILQIPENLGSDYYFIDACLNGAKSKVRVNPLMIINPKIPPANPCTNNSIQTFNVERPITPLKVETDRSSYSTRELVKMEVSGDASVREIAVSVSRNDKLSRWMDELTGGVNISRTYEISDQLEKQGFIVSAIVTKNGIPARNARLLASLQGRQADLASGTTDNDGKVTFLLPYPVNASRIILSGEGSDPSKYEFAFPGDPVNIQTIDFPCLVLTESLRSDIEERILNSRLDKRYHGDEIKIFATPDFDTTDFYGNPDQRYLLDDYTRFPNMEEVITEFITQVRIRKESGSAKLQILNSPAKGFFNDQGLLLLDGVPVADAKTLLELNPLLIRSIDVVSRKFTLGDSEFNGIVHFKSYRSDMAGVALSAKQGARDFRNIRFPVSMREHEYSGKDDPRPVLRNTIYWESGIVPDQKGKASISFPASDAEGDYRILVRGMNGKGEVITAGKSIFIKAGN